MFEQINDDQSLWLRPNSPWTWTRIFIESQHSCRIMLRGYQRDVPGTQISLYQTKTLFFLFSIRVSRPNKRKRDSHGCYELEQRMYLLGLKPNEAVKIKKHRWSGDVRVLQPTAPPGGCSCILHKEKSKNIFFKKGIKDGLNIIFFYPS